MADRISFSEYALVDLLDAFASNEPIPGGGSAVALVGALGVSLLIKVAGLPRTRTQAPEEATDLAEAASRLRPIRDQLLQLVDDDSEAYRALLAAYRLARAAGDEQAARVEAVQTGLRGATDVPLETMRLCQQALAGAVVVARNGLAAAASDVAVAIELLAAAVRGCAVNIDGNLGPMTEASYRERVNLERQQLDADSADDAGRARALLPS